MTVQLEENWYFRSHLWTSDNSYAVVTTEMLIWNRKCFYIERDWSKSTVTTRQTKHQYYIQTLALSYMSKVDLRIMTKSNPSSNDNKKNSNSVRRKVNKQSWFTYLFETIVMLIAHSRITTVEFFIFTNSTHFLFVLEIDFPIFITISPIFFLLFVFV